MPFGWGSQPGRTQRVRLPNSVHTSTHLLQAEIGGVDALRLCLKRLMHSESVSIYGTARV